MAEIMPQFSHFLHEWAIYGNDSYGRVAVVRPDGGCDGGKVSADDKKKSFKEMFNDDNENLVGVRTILEKYYEIKDHLGNVRLVLMDQKVRGEAALGDFAAIPVELNNYYPFGMPEAGRSWSYEGEIFQNQNKKYENYTYGYNGMQRDNSKGTGSGYTTLFREYDPEIARWKSLDPKLKDFPSESPFSAMGNNPIMNTDVLGDVSKQHNQIIQLSSKYNRGNDKIEWNTSDIIKWKVSGNNAYLFKMKSEFVKEYANVINDASSQFCIPTFLLAGIAFTEFGGDPMWIDDIADIVRSFDWSGPDWMDKNLTLTNHPDKTSFGNLSIQVRTAAEALGYNPNQLNSDDRNAIINSLKDPIQNIFIAAKVLLDLKNIDFKNTPSDKLTQFEIQIIATRYNRGAGIKLDKLMQNLGYGKSIYKHQEEIKSQLKD